MTTTWITADALASRTPTGRRRSVAETCSNVSTYRCESPANVRVPTHVRTRCVACGDAVCQECSQTVVWHGRRGRVCDNCLVDSGATGAAKVVQKDYVRAGYPKPTLRRAREIAREHGMVRR
jgi:hypothetical protein